ncbi:MAG TPA: PEP/pyruvate-binding domain-containing protein [Candidatus Limnocylindrales bacterium]|nr:PEP/pyruvate-binding domain-containing protein [Candidatus Limnocylindrales bacterium]
MESAVVLVEWLGSASDPEALGGKGASLDRLARLGFRIPPGFCLTTEAFRTQLRSMPQASALLSRLAASNDPSLGAELAATLTEAALSTDIDEPLRSALATLDEGARARSGRAARLAVRSSAIGEDSSAASYAGLHETELDRSVDEIPAAIRRCWASLWSAPALAYRTRRQLPLDGAAMAVVVQELVPADAAAVAFTRHPVTGRDDQLVLTAIRGLGEAMVSGTVTPDTFVVDRATGAVAEHTLGDDAERPLDPASLRALVDLVLRVEAGFGAPVDVEAAMANREWYLLQARPITTSVSAVRA